MSSNNGRVRGVTNNMQNLSLQGNGNGNRRQANQGAPNSRAAVREENGNTTRRPRVSHLLRTRPEKYKDSKCGTSGTVVKLTANYFPIKPVQPNWTLYHYHADFLPNVEETFIRKALMRPYKNEFNGYVFDGSALYTSSKLLNDTKEILTTRSNGDKVKIVLKYVGNISAEKALQVWNIIMRSSLEALNLQMIRRNYFDFDPSVVQSIPDHKLKLIPGYITSIRQHERSILMCAELTYKVLRTETVYDVFKNMINDPRRRGDVKSNFKDEVVGMIVMTNYNQKTYKIFDVDYNSSPMSTFTMKDNSVITYMQYYKNKKQVNIRDPKQFLLVSKPTEKQQRGGNTDYVFLVPELCIPTGFTESMKNNFHLMKAVSEHTNVNPSNRVDRLLKMNQRILGTPGSQKVLNDWHVRLDHQLVQFEGRELPEIAIVYGGARERVAKGGDWTRDFLQQQLFEKSKLTNWVVVVDKSLEMLTKKFLDTLRKSVSTIGWSFAQPKMVFMADERSITIINSLRTAKNYDPQLLLIVVRSKNLYSIIKKFCVKEEGILSQVVMEKNLRKDDRALQSISTKIGIQMNCKLGAMPWTIKLPTNGMMFVGFDVCHDKADKAKSFGALVATMDMKRSSNYFSVAFSHGDGTELSSKMAPYFLQALEAYKSEHGALPGHIIFYRDGVGDGQMEQVVETELDQIKNAINSIRGEQHINFTFVVVCKRINTRIFKDSQNPNPGTVVDDVITLPERYDFFLVSQKTTRGTASPTSYNVIYDSSTIMTPDRLQNLTFKLCHAYYNWTGTVCVPSVCQYAHKLSLLMGQHVHAPANTRLNKKLYFL